MYAVPMHLFNTFSDPLESMIYQPATAAAPRPTNVFLISLFYSPYEIYYPVTKQTFDQRYYCRVKNVQ